MICWIAPMSMRKYSCASRSRKPAISLHGISGRSLLREGLHRLADDEEVVEDCVSRQPLTDVRCRSDMRANRSEGLGDVVETIAIGPPHTGRASRSARERTRGFMKRGAATSTRAPRIRSASCRNPIRSRSVRSGSRSTRRSTSLSILSSPRAMDPKTRMRSTPWCRPASRRRSRARRNASIRAPGLVLARR